MKRFPIRLDKKLARRSMPRDPRACILATGIKEQYGADEVFIAGSGGWAKAGRKTYHLKHTARSRLVMGWFDHEPYGSPPRRVEMRIVNPKARNLKAAAGAGGLTAGAIMVADGLGWVLIMAVIAAIAAIAGLVVRQNKGHGKIKLAPHSSGMPGHLIDATGETLFAQAKRKRATPRTAAAPAPVRATAPAWPAPVRAQEPVSTAPPAAHPQPVVPTAPEPARERPQYASAPPITPPAEKDEELLVPLAEAWGDAPHEPSHAERQAAVSQ